MEMKAFLTDAGSAVVTQLLASQGELTVTRAEIRQRDCHERGGGTGEDRADFKACKCKPGVVHAVQPASGHRRAIQQRGSGGKLLRWGNRHLLQRTLRTKRRSALLLCDVRRHADTIVAGSTALYTRTYRVFMFVSDVQNVTGRNLSGRDGIAPAIWTRQFRALETEIAAELEEKADKTLLTAAVGTPAGRPDEARVYGQRREAWGADGGGGEDGAGGAAHLERRRRR